MPIYEYECRKCGTCFEEIMSATSEKMPECPRCRTDRDVVKRMSACARVAGGDSGGSGGCTPRGGFS